MPRSNRELYIRNPIYEQVFTADWAKAALPRDRNRLTIAVGIALLIIGFGFGVWYTQFLPRPYIQALQTASDDYPVALEAHNSLSNIRFYADVADSLLADFWQRRALRAEAAENRDEALLSWLESVRVQDDASRRGSARHLVGADYEGIVSTYRTGGSVGAVAFSPNGEWVVTGSGDGTARVWAAKTGQPVSAPLRHEGSVRAVAFSPNGQMILSSTLWWIHLSSFMNESLQPKASRLLPARSSNAYLFLDDTGDQLQIALRVNSNDIEISTIRLHDPDAPQLAGNSQHLLEEWQDKLALEFNDGKIVPTWPPPNPDRQKAEEYGGNS